MIYIVLLFIGLFMPSHHDVFRTDLLKLYRATHFAHHFEKTYQVEALRGNDASRCLTFEAHFCTENGGERNVNVGRPEPVEQREPLFWHSVHVDGIHHFILDNLFATLSAYFNGGPSHYWSGQLSLYRR